jgi:hypothetical protein
MADIAAAFPGTKFTVYTKTSFPLKANCTIPKNLAILRSVWGSFDPMPGSSFPKAVFVPKPVFVPKGDSVPKGGFTCPGSCDSCRVCWNGKTTVYFKQH